MIHRSKFLVIVDDSDELNVAIRFAAKRAQSTKGGVILLNIIEQFDPQQWQSIEEIILQEARDKAQEKLQKWSKVINDITNIVPELIVKEGIPSEKNMLFALLSTINGPREKFHLSRLLYELVKHPKLIHKFLQKVVVFLFKTCR